MKITYLNETTDVEINYKISQLLSKYDISQYQSEVWEILNKSYETIGGVKNASSPIALFNKTNELAICKSISGGVSAAAVYSYKDGGRKLIAIGSDGSYSGKEQAKNIIKRDINEQFEKWYWIEASGPIEHLYKKFNGYPVPSGYAAVILGKPLEDIKIIDETHYVRTVGELDEPVKKMIFGFKDKATYEMIVNEIDDYYSFRERINRTPVTETLTYTSKYSISISKALYIINLIIDIMDETSLSNLTPYMNSNLTAAIEVLMDTNYDDTQINECIRLGKYILNTYDTIYLHKFKHYNIKC